MTNLQENSLYELTFPTGAKCVVRLAKIMRYLASGISDPDYFFQCLTPDFVLLKSSTIEGGFPLPQCVIDQITIRELTDELSQSLYKSDTPFVIKWKK